MNTRELIERLQAVEEDYDGDLPVVTDQEGSIIGVEYNDTEGAPAVVLIIEAE